jgi:type I restriction enzyme S subunit
MVEFQKVKIGDVLTERREVPDLFDVESGAISVVSKIGFAQGKIELRAEGGTKTGMILIRPGDLVLSGINAAKGAIAICDERAENPIAATIHYSSYIPNKQKVDIRYLWWFFRSNFFREILMQNLPGGIKTELKAIRFLPLEIPLPPLTEQRRIVARIEALAARVAEAQSLRREAAEEADKLLPSTLSKIFDQNHPIGDLVSINDSDLVLNKESRNPAATYPDEEFRYVDISSVESKSGRITGQQQIFGRDAPSRARRVIRNNDVIISTVRPNLKSFALIPDELDNQICSTGFAVFTCPDSILPEFLLYQFFSDFFIEQVMKSVTGGHYPAINDKNLKQVLLILPPLEEQRRLVAYLDGLQAQVSALRVAQAETGKELSALMPSVLDRAFKGEL